MKTIKSVDEMIMLGQQLAQDTSKLLIYWELWAGKTHLIKGFAAWLSIDANKVQSPTYTYINAYDDKLLHIDMYRLDELESLIEKGILDQMNMYPYITIEWPKFIENYADNTWTKVEITKIDENTRQVLISK